MFSQGARFVGASGQLTRADDEERRQLRSSLRAALDRAGGLPL